MAKAKYQFLILSRREYKIHFHSVCPVGLNGSAGFLNFPENIFRTSKNIVYIYGMKQQYDTAALATSVVTFRRVTKGLTMREAAEMSGVCAAIIHKAETQKPISKTSFIKICAWLEKEPSEFFKTV